MAQGKLKKVAKKVALIRHGNKDGDALTELGKKQILTQVRHLAGLGYCPDTIVFSGAKRTQECSEIAQPVFPGALGPVENRTFHYEVPFNLCLGNSVDRYNSEMAEISEAGGTLATALRISAYARMTRDQVANGIANIGPHDTVFVFSHSPLVTLAAPDPDIVPYDVPEATAVIYTVEDDGTIVDAKIILCPEVD